MVKSPKERWMLAHRPKKFKLAGRKAPFAVVMMVAADGNLAPQVKGHSKSSGRDSLPDQIRRECRQRGFVEPAVTVVGEWDGYVIQRHGQPKPAGGAYKVELEFPEPVPGPVLLGSNSHFGMGRFVPSKEVLREPRQSWS